MLLALYSSLHILLLAMLKLFLTMTFSSLFIFFKSNFRCSKWEYAFPPIVIVWPSIKCFKNVAYHDVCSAYFPNVMYNEFSMRAVMTMLVLSCKYLRIVFKE